METPKLSVIGNRKIASKSLKEMLKTEDDGLVDFVRRCFVWNPKYRMTPDEALQHDWLEEAIKRVKK
jgi:dual specificity tyrosine-phosphorylation-regulated kinase 2/3/4